MNIGERILTRLKAIGISQSELARRVGMSQGAMNHLIAGRSRSSTHLHKIARELTTTVAYLTGEIDDPDLNAPTPPPAPGYQLVTVQIALPEERALARMFEGMLRTMNPQASVDEQAKLLAKRLPTALSQLRDLLPASAPAPAAAPEDPATLLPAAPQ